MPSRVPNLPSPILLAVAGLSATVLLVITAIAVRTPPHEDLEKETPAAESAGTTAAGSAAPQETAGAHKKTPGTSGATATARAPAPALGDEPRAVRAQLSKDIQFGRFKNAVDALGRLLDLAPKAAEDPEVRADVVELSMRVMLLQGDEPETVFKLITTRMGTTGIDILYELITTRGGSRAAARAEELMRDEGAATRRRRSSSGRRRTATAAPSGSSSSSTGAAAGTAPAAACTTIQICARPWTPSRRARTEDDHRGSGALAMACSVASTCSSARITSSAGALLVARMERTVPARSRARARTAS
jgi:hypothetical protein